MSLKPQLDKAPVVVSSPTAWGVLADAGEPARVIRFECEDGAYSYPYHALTCWILREGDPETLVINAGSEKIIAHGRELSVVRDALDAGRLRVLRVAGKGYIKAATGVIVTALKIDQNNRQE